MESLSSQTSTLIDVLSKAMEKGATDIHIGELESIYMRIDNELLKQDDMHGSYQIFLDIASQCGIKLIEKQSYDAAFTYKNTRIRVHLYRSNGHWSATLRILYNRTIGFERDRQADLFRSICTTKDGLVLITGPTSSGKTFTLASCVSYINEHMNRHIVTLEDPIEYIFTNKCSLIHQRELGKDIQSMSTGVRDALREDPDIIIIGELRDSSTLEAALHAAETGHLVFATMHTQRATMAINRMLSMFSSEQQEEMRHQLSQVLRVIICQRLFVFDGKFITARDILINTPAVANLIRQRKEPQICSIQETTYPMQTMEMAVKELQKTWGARSEFTALLGYCYETI